MLNIFSKIQLLCFFCTLFLLRCDFAITSTEIKKAEMNELHGHILTKLTSDLPRNTHFFISLTYSCQCNSRTKRATKIERGTMEVRRANIVIVIRKGALELIDTRFGNLQNHFGLSEIEINNTDCCLGETSDIQLDLNSIIKPVTKILIEDAAILLVFVFNEKNYSNGLTIYNPYVSPVRPLPLKTLIKKFEACAFFFPDLTSWCRFINLSATYYRRLNINHLAEFLKKLVETWAILNTIQTVIDNPQCLDKLQFFQTCKLLGMFFSKVKLVTTLVYINILKPTHVELLRMFNRLSSCILYDEGDSIKMEELKIQLLESFLALFLNLHKVMVKSKYHQVKDLLYRTYFTIIDKFTPSEFYNLPLKGFINFKDAFEYFLERNLGFSYIFDGTHPVGVIYCETNYKTFCKSLESSNSFLIRYLTADKKVWIHFGSAAIKKLRVNVDKHWLPIFWRALRNYAVTLRADGILMTFEDEMPDKLTLDTSKSLKIPIKRSAFWNLIDPTLEGRVVFHRSENMAIVSSPKAQKTIILEIDGKSNLPETDFKLYGEIGLFYEDRHMRDEENDDIITALPGCMYSESFIITDTAGNDIDFEKLKTVNNKILEVAIFKVAVVLGCDPKLMDSSRQERDQSGKSNWHNQNISFCVASKQIFGTLKELASRNKNFREILLELAHIDMFLVDMMTDIAELLQEIELTTVQYSHLHESANHLQTKVLSAIVSNSLTSKSLNYLDIFPLLHVDEPIVQRICKSAPLKKISLFLPCSCSFYICYFDSLLEILSQKDSLQEMQLHLDKNYQLLSRHSIEHLRKMPLKRLSVFGYPDDCHKFVSTILNNCSDYSSDLLESLVSLHYSFNKSFSCSRNKKLAKILKKKKARISKVLSQSTIETLSITKLLGFCATGNANLDQKPNLFISRYFSVNS